MIYTGAMLYGPFVVTVKDGQEPLSRKAAAQAFARSLNFPVIFFYEGKATIMNPNEPLFEDLRIPGLSEPAALRHY